MMDIILANNDGEKEKKESRISMYQVPKESMDKFIKNRN